MVAPQLPFGFDFTDPDMYRLRIPVEEFAELRGTAPVWWNPQPKGIAGFGDDGYWVVSRHAEVKEVSLDHQRFSAAEPWSAAASSSSGLHTTALVPATEASALARPGSK